ncbi:hypothetical protein NP233_g8140 [Leucocoprinus birnbaumii]|uniref:Uncharacterized protein n=1 Tax=Leucocoprinus birnbaumii TaxID=56174 RepID=A0AAD5YS52_9AGAR|nr:hypothetical protein NP233_g8140 [Leucocoprinus birnbaumii]
MEQKQNGSRIATYDEVKPLIVIADGVLDCLLQTAFDGELCNIDDTEVSNNDVHSTAENPSDLSELSDLPSEYDSDAESDLLEEGEIDEDSGAEPVLTNLSTKDDDLEEGEIRSCSESCIDTDTLPVTAGIYEAIPLHRAPIGYSLPKLQLKALIKAQYKLVTWDGITPRPLLDSQGRVIVVLASQPNEQSFLDKCKHLFHTMMEVASQIEFSEAGSDKTCIYGASPQADENVYWKTLIFRTLLTSIAVRNLVNLWSPNMYKCLRQCIKKLHEHRSLGKKLNFLTPAGIYPRVAFNFGPNAWTNHHCDPQDYALAWCVVQVLGPFDPEEGGHLVIEEAKLVIQFPPGSIILLPSATFTHGNVPVHLKNGEGHASVTQLQLSLKKASKKIREEMAQRREELWENDRCLIFQCIQELVEVME